MSTRNPNCTSETRTEVPATVTNMDKLAKIPSDRNGFGRYQQKLIDIWFELALGEVICRTLYALVWESAHLVEIPTMTLSFTR